MSARPRLVVGLGNPGVEYAGTRHNIGFAVVERVAVVHGGSFKRKLRFAAEIAEAVIHGNKVALVKPRTFMNRSGQAVAALLGWLKLAPAELLVVVDDADLPLGQIRLRGAGGSGGHNGLRSIIESLGGHEEFARLRVGIGRPGAERGGSLEAGITDHVLGRFAPAERAAMAEATAMAAEAVACCLKEGLAAAMNQFNRRASPKGGPEGESV